MSLFIKPRERDIGDFSVKRVLPRASCRHVGPFVFFDHMGPASFKAGHGINVRSHPHIGLMTMTYLFSGEILHKDSLGSVQEIHPGAINLMVAGKGIVHAELTTEKNKTQDHELDGLQLWLALPDDQEEVDPEFIHYPADQVPSREMQGAHVRVLVGEAFGLTSPVKTFIETLYVEVSAKSGSSIDVPHCEETALYVVKGSLTAGKDVVSQNEMLVLDAESHEVFTCAEDCLFVIIGGRSVGERHMFWNFVSSRKERIEEAKKDWQEEKFDQVPGETDRIPLP